jgi:hypothetical protein
MIVNTFLSEPYSGTLTYDHLLELQPGLGEDRGLGGKEIASRYNFFAEADLEIIYLEDSLWAFKDEAKAKTFLAVAGWGNPSKTY